MGLPTVALPAIMRLGERKNRGEACFAAVLFFLDIRREKCEYMFEKQLGNRPEML
jgi:hypothetical protein